jgi:hypothetical protein
MKHLFKTTILLLILYPITITADAQAGKENVIIENYYKVKWGYADEFIGLWKANHYPLLDKAREKGDIVQIIAQKPSFHSGEDTRWDFKVTITFRDLKTAFDINLTMPYKKDLYPDQQKLEKEEQHRFELLLAHWDVFVEPVIL